MPSLNQKRRVEAGVISMADEKFLTRREFINAMLAVGGSVRWLLP